MNIKSLLLGSAAALVAVSGARAADAVVVAEPEPMEYVRVCDTYGVGFYYIPGTETCLRISGLIRYDIDYNDRDDVTAASTVASQTFVLRAGDNITVPAAAVGGAPTDPPVVIAVPVGSPLIGTTATVGEVTPGAVTRGLDEGWAKTAIARVNLDARSETELGTFRRFIRIAGSIQGGQDSGDARIEYAFIELGGLLVGLYDTLYDGDLAPEFDSAGGTAAHQIRYTFDAGNGITIQASVEEQDYNLDYTPNFVGRVGLAQGWGSLAGFVAYDATTEEVGVKGIASFSATDAITLQAMAIYESGVGDFSVGPANGNTGYKYSLAGAVGFKATDKISIWGGGQYFGDRRLGGSDDYTIGGQIDYKVVENMLARVQVAYNGGDTQDFTSAKFRLESAF